MTTKKNEPEAEVEVQEVEPEEFDELVEDGEFEEVEDTSEGQVSPPMSTVGDDAEPGESQVPGDFNESAPESFREVPEDAEEVEEPELLPPDYYATQPSTTHISPEDARDALVEANSESEENSEE